MFSPINHYITSEDEKHATRSDAFGTMRPTQSFVSVLYSLAFLIECKFIISKLVNIKREHRCQVRSYSSEMSV